MMQLPSPILAVFTACGPQLPKPVISPVTGNANGRVRTIDPREGERWMDSSLSRSSCVG